MKNFFKKLISRKEKQESSNLTNDEQITFEDLKLQKIVINLFKTGNDYVLRLSEEKSGFEIILDKEKSFLVSLILQNYVLDSNLEKALTALKEKE